MSPEQLDTRQRRAEREVFVISAAENGWSVRPAANPRNSYTVADAEGSLACTCMDYQANVEQDPDWKCKHVLAVEKYRANGGHVPTQPHNYEAEERAAIQAASEPVPLPAGGQPLSHMLVKRSLSPDGRIDSISIEFSFELSQTTAAKIKSKALNALQLQTEIVRGFLGGNNGKAPQPRPQPQRDNGNGAVSARVLDVGIANGRYGERFFLNVEVNGRRARLFGTATQIASVISDLGGDVVPEELEAGMRIDLPCRAVTERSQDGRYLNVTQVLPLARRGANGSPRR